MPPQMVQNGAGGPSLVEPFFLTICVTVVVPFGLQKVEPKVAQRHDRLWQKSSWEPPWSSFGRQMLPMRPQTQFLVNFCNFSTNLVQILKDLSDILVSKSDTYYYFIHCAHCTDTHTHIRMVVVVVLVWRMDVDYRLCACALSPFKIAYPHSRC